jgi:NADH pyrophosphatase NudC (nudix superfamily)
MNDLDSILQTLHGCAYIADATARPVELGEGTIAHAAQLRTIARELRQGALVVLRVMARLETDYEWAQRLGLLKSCPDCGAPLIDTQTDGADVCPHCGYVFVKVPLDQQ